MTENTINPALRDFDNFPDTAHIRPKQCAQLMDVSIATYWRLVKAKSFPVYKLTERTHTVKAGDLRAFMAGKVGS